MKTMNNKGFSLVEISVALALVAMLLGIVSAGGGMMNKSRVQREVESVESLRLASQNYLSSNKLNYTGVSVDALKTAGLIPATFEAENANSFGGNYIVTANTADATKVDIALTNIPESAGADIVAAFKGRAQELGYDKTSLVLRTVF